MNAMKNSYELCLKLNGNSFELLVKDDVNAHKKIKKKYAEHSKAASQMNAEMNKLAVLNKKYELLLKLEKPTEAYKILENIEALEESINELVPRIENTMDLFEDMYLEKLMLCVSGKDSKIFFEHMHDNGVSAKMVFEHISEAIGAEKEKKS